MEMEKEMEKEKSWQKAMLAFLQDGTPSSDLKLEKKIRAQAKDFWIWSIRYDSEQMLVHVDHDGVEISFLEIEF